MNIWIVGSDGLLGKALVRTCQKRKIAYLATGRDKADITDLPGLLAIASSHPFTHIINCAAYTDVDGAEKNPKQAFAVNAEGPAHLGIIGREFGLRVVHVSTDYVFDGKKGAPYVETDTPSPLGVYGKSKWEGEKKLLAELPTATIVRTSWLFGDRGKNFISRSMHFLQTKEEIHVDHEQQNRATFSHDLAEALIDISCHSGIFHFANQGSISRFDVTKSVHEIARLRGIPLKCQTIYPQASETFSEGAPRPTNTVLSTEKIEKVLGAKPRYWKDVLSEYLLYVKKTP